MAEYKDCYVAFLDILGFKNLVKKASCDEMLAIFNEVKQQYVVTRMDQTQLFDPEDMHMKIMSDSVCIYIYSWIPNALQSLIFICIHFQSRMLKLDEPVLMRGGISKGLLYADNDIIFGEGLVNAYLLEKDNAIVPRIILTKNTLDSCKCDEDVKAYEQNLVFKDYDGFYSLDYCFFFYWDAHKEHENKIERVCNYVQAVLDTTTDNSIRNKFLYISNRIQSAIDRGEGATNPNA